MTEKRYKRYLSFVLDDYANGSDRLMTIREVIPRLNELYEENEQLKDALNQRTDQCDKYYKENEQLKYDATVLICSNQEYRKENEQLKSKNKELKKEIKAKNEIIEMYYELVKE